MQPALLIRLQPSGPWRYGPGEGGQNRIDTLFRSDRLYSAVTLAMRHLGFLDEWLDATARSSTPAVTLSSLLPYQAQTLFAPPPLTLWPPPSSAVSTSSPVFAAKVRWKTARFVPLTVIEALFNSQSLIAEQWIADPESGCLLRRDRPSPSPFRITSRSSAAVDRVTRGFVHIDSWACVEFAPGSGLWCVARFADPSSGSLWKDRLRGALQLLADTGFGGRRTSGWGQAESPKFEEGIWPALLFPSLLGTSENGSQSGKNGNEASLYWLLSLYSPAEADSVDWSAGSYQSTVRGGRIETGCASIVEKKRLRMISEGSVIAAKVEPAGAAVDVAPDGFSHAVYRSGFALALRLPSLDRHEQQGPVETPPEGELEPRPCEEPRELPAAGTLLENTPESARIEGPDVPEPEEPRV